MVDIGVKTRFYYFSKKTHMKFTVTLSLILLTIGCTAFGQGSSSISAAAAEKGLIKISIMYPFAEGKTFNMEYY